MFARTRSTQKEAGKAFEDACRKVKDFIHSDLKLSNDITVQARVNSRIKSRYQVYLKMRRKGLRDPDAVKDALGIRVILDVTRRSCETESDYLQRSNRLCYLVLEGVSRLDGWEALPGRLKDYIQFPKDSGYQSLHQYIICGSRRTTVEVQVRTWAMHVQAERGEAAHWWYKDMLYRPDLARSSSYRMGWRSAYQLTAKSAPDLFRMAKKQLANSRVYFYHADKVVGLWKQERATVLDAAFASNITAGLRATVLRVNGEIVANTQCISTDDVLSIECDSTQPVNPDKLVEVHTSHALSALRDHFLMYNPFAIVCMGLVKLLLTLELNSHMVSLSDAKQLCRLVRDRLQQPIGTYLFNLGCSSNSTRTLSHLLNIPPDQLVSAPYTTALAWVQQQYGPRGGIASEALSQNNNLHGFHADILRPLLDDILPRALHDPEEVFYGRRDPPPFAAGDTAVAVQSMEACWCQLVGSNCSFTTVFTPPTFNPFPFQFGKPAGC